MRDRNLTEKADSCTGVIRVGGCAHGPSNVHAGCSLKFPRIKVGCVLPSDSLRGHWRKGLPHPLQALENQNFLMFPFGPFLGGRCPDNLSPGYWRFLVAEPKVTL